MSQAILPLSSDCSSDPARLLHAKSPFDAPSPVKLKIIQTGILYVNQGIHIW